MKKKTPIELIFREIVKREMTPQERRILLRKRKKTGKLRADNTAFDDRG